ncbi:GNAT family N-acetyltransferase [Oleiagrimonas citrea]|uniref:GNAT family N-acetyltransferase n=1 Tax=Oleiagrimonas citrea TaxID=1665687 RepID=A0A846ZQW7_9GAMM|nr:GNAT family N-acetyltransferase [Oleiagrimonas citrea]NKZ39889.1 GNAT family N-acetyltransferase [Oleiagrimonas citrea]
MTRQPTLATERLVLRPFAAADAEAVQRLAGDARIADTTTHIPHPYPDGAAEAWIAQHPADFAARLRAVFAVTLRRDARLVGTVSLNGMSRPDARAELGYWIGVEHWGQGYATEAAARLLAFGHEAWGLSRFVAHCLARNPGSARVMEKLGMKQEGRLPQHLRKNGRFEDILLYGLNLPSRGRDAPNGARPRSRTE